MTLALLRLDDRLVHGQVVVGWAQALAADRIVLVDDRIRASEWERDLYALGMPPGLPLVVTSVAEALLSVREWIGASLRTIVVTADVETVTRLCATAPDIDEVNVGGMHARADRAERLPYVFMSAAEADALRALAARGVEVTAQDVPTARPIPLRDLVGAAG